MIAHEIEKELLRRHEDIEDKTAASSNQKGKPKVQEAR
jgi:hypothetical protein